MNPSASNNSCRNRTIFPQLILAFSHLPHEIFYIAPIVTVKSKRQSVIVRPSGTKAVEKASKLFQACKSSLSFQV